MLRPCTSNSISLARLWRGVARVAMALLFSCGFAAAEQVRLAWDANLEPDLAGYRIHFGTQAGVYSGNLDVGLATEGVVEDLLPGTEYHFAVSALNEAGLESELSEPISYRTAAVFSQRAFAGLLESEEGGVQGSFTAALNASGAVSGLLTLGGKRYGWSGVFDRDGVVAVEIIRKNGVVASLALQLAGDGHSLTGAVETAGGAAVLQGQSIARQLNHASAGRYTMALEGADSALGGGYGFGTIQVSKRGFARFTGTLPGGAPFNAGAGLNSAAAAPFYQYQRAKGRTVSGWVQFREVPGESDADGVWRLDVAGSSEDIALRAARHPLPAQTFRIAVADTAELALEVKGWAGNELISVELPPGNPMTARAASGELISLKVSRQTGLFTGTCVSVSRKPFRFAGALLQKGAPAGFGLVRGARGSIELHPIPSEP